MDVSVTGNLSSFNAVVLVPTIGEVGDSAQFASSIPWSALICVALDYGSLTPFPRDGL